MKKALPRLELMRSETFPFPQRYATGVSPLGILSYFDSGPPQAAEQPPERPLVLLHALGTNFTLWEHIVPSLARRTRVIGLDMPGCGHSVRPKEPYRMAHIVESVLGLIDHLGLEQPIVVGHSFGGRVAIEVALARPGGLAGLVLLNSAGLTRYPRFFDTLGRKLLKPGLVGTLMLGLAPIFVGRIFSEPSERSERFLDQVFSRAEAGYAYDFANHAYPMLPDLVSDVIERVPELRLPVQVVWGERDALLSYETVEPVLKTMPDVTIRRLPSCGHMPNLEQPEELLETLHSFLDRLHAPPEGHAGHDGHASRHAHLHRRHRPSHTGKSGRAG